MEHYAMNSLKQKEKLTNYIARPQDPFFKFPSHVTYQVMSRG